MQFIRKINLFLTQGSTGYVGGVTTGKIYGKRPFDPIIDIFGGITGLIYDR